ncbi:MAG: hypothetical protein KGO81_07705 [Bacteroidota bacterium]|nr:hypothetical protein [Bacteroidota bacterium]
MKTKQYIVRMLLAFSILTTTAIAANAQIDGWTDTPSDAPIDGGLSILIAGGIGYGVKKMREKKMKATNDTK